MADDEMKLLRQRARGEEAKRLLENSILKETFATVEKEIIAAWQDSMGGEGVQREEAYRLLRALRRLKGVMESFMYTGEIARKDLLEIEAEAKARERRA